MHSMAETNYRNLKLFWCWIILSSSHIKFVVTARKQLAVQDMPSIEQNVHIPCKKLNFLPQNKTLLTHKFFSYFIF
jgi:hypothetical protein